MATSDFRVIEFKRGSGVFYRAVHEVRYDESGRLESYLEPAEYAWGPGIHEKRNFVPTEIVRHLIRALEQPVLSASEFQ